MSVLNLRPVDPESTPSPSSSTTPGDNSPRYNKSTAHARTSSPSGRSRRPLSPSSLRDVDLTQSSERSHFPAPPTGHDLMALFPAAAPECGPEARGGPTSGFFQRQERAFFAQAGKEIVRVRVEVDMPSGGPDADPKTSKTGSRPWLGPGPHQSPMQTSATTGQLFPPNSRQSQRGTVPVTQLLPVNCHPPTQQVPPNLHPSIPQQSSPPPQDPSQAGPHPPRPDYPHDEYDDESWKKPMPHNERRRAGKHTKRVIVR